MRKIINTYLAQTIGIFFFRRRSANSISTCDFTYVSGLYLIASSAAVSFFCQCRTWQSLVKSNTGAYDTGFIRLYRSNRRVPPTRDHRPDKMALMVLRKYLQNVGISVYLWISLRWIDDLYVRTPWGCKFNELLIDRAATRSL